MFRGALSTARDYEGERVSWRSEKKEGGMQVKRSTSEKVSFFMYPRREGKVHEPQLTIVHGHYVEYTPFI
jgi:hypothetical protein